MIYVHSEAEPFFLAGNQTAVLFIHGFTASPAEIYPVAVKLHNINHYTVSGPLLPGHGSHPHLLNRTAWEDWYAAVEEECRFLMKNYEQVYVAGLSMGGLLAVHAGANIDGVKGVISINAPIFNRYPLLTAMAPILQVICPYFPKSSRSKSALLKEKGRFAYNCTPVKAFRSMVQLRKQVMYEIGTLSTRLLVIQSAKDESVNPRSGEYMIKKAGRTYSRLVILTESGHIATMGSEIERIVAEINMFIKDNEI